MADIKISALPTAGALSGTEIEMIVQGGQNVKMTLAAFLTYINANAVLPATSKVAGLDDELAQMSTIADAKLPKAGGTMTGTLTLSGNAVSGLQAVSYQQLTTALADTLQKSGGTMTGILTLSADATTGLQAVSYQQLTAAQTANLPKSGGTMTGTLVLNADAVSGLQAVSYQQLTTALTGVLSKSGGTMTGILTLNADATTGLQAVSFQQLTTALNLKAPALPTIIQLALGTRALTQADNNACFINSSGSTATLTIANGALTAGFQCDVISASSADLSTNLNLINIIPAAYTTSVNNVAGLPFLILQPGQRMTLQYDGTIFRVKSFSGNLPELVNTSSNRSVSAGDWRCTLQQNSASAQILSIPIETSANFYPIGFWVKFRQTGAGQTTFSAVAGAGQATLISADSAFKTRTTGSTALLTKTGPLTWVVEGDLTV